MATPVRPPAGGNDPVRQAAMSNLRGGGQPAAASPTQAPNGPAPGAQGPGGVPGQGNEVAMHLAAAYEALLRTGPTDQNLAALESFWRSVLALNPAGNSPQAPLGQAPGTTPLPSAPPTGGIAPAGSPMVPPRQV
jgi:hypothetical protein